MPTYSYNNQNKSHARSLRREQTHVEKLLWFKIRSRQISNAKFRRQHPISHYILDFYCEELKLAIELDGSQHNGQKGRIYDKHRTEVLNSLGISVVRFWDNEVIKDMDGVLEVIRKNIGKKTSPQSSP